MGGTDVAELQKPNAVIEGAAGLRQFLGGIFSLREDSVAMEIAVGDTVVYSKYAGTEYKEGDVEYLVLREDDILFKK